jgi:hypothetical protein
LFENKEDEVHQRKKYYEKEQERKGKTKLYEHAK